MSNINETNIKRDWNDKEVRKAYMKEYMKNYRKDNMEYYNKEKKYVAVYLNNKYNTDPEYRENKNKRNLENYHKKRQQMLANPISV
jgi:hypothetical protein